MPLRFKGDLLDPVFWVFGTQVLCVPEWRTRRFEVYARESGGLLFSFGGVGQGPGEFENISQVACTEEAFMVSTGTRLCFFSRKDGGLLCEKRLPTIAFKPLLPLGEGYVAADYTRILDFDVRVRRLEFSLPFCLLDEQFRIKRDLVELPERPPSLMSKEGGREMQYPLGGPLLQVFQGRSYIGSPLEGFLVHVFGSGGEPLHTIRLPWVPRRLAEEERPAVRARFAAMLKRERLQGIFFRKTHPAFREMVVDEAGIVFQIHHERGGVLQFLQTDLEGNPLGSYLLPDTTAVQSIAGGRIYCSREGVDGKVAFFSYRMAKGQGAFMPLEACGAPEEPSLGREDGGEGL